MPGQRGDRHGEHDGSYGISQAVLKVYHPGEQDIIMNLYTFTVDKMLRN
jgi:hypothetical protein